MTPFEAMVGRAERHLESACPHMRAAIRQLGPCSLQLQSDRFQMLVRSITSQQISSAASRAIIARLKARVAPNALEPDTVRACGEDGLRNSGYSRRKACYVLGLADAILEGEVDLDAMDALGDDEIVERLTCLRGIGEWTAQMFLIFALGRPDVFPYADLGVRSALRKFHGLTELPAKRRSIELAGPWRPYASIASWYCWRSLDAKALAGKT